jgi:hypothetical protein
MTKNKIIAELKLNYPTLKTGDDENGYVALSNEEYEETISKWADAELAKIAAEQEAEAQVIKKAATEAKLAALGLDVDDLKVLGLG